MKKILYLPIIFTMLLAGSCKKFLDVNKDPNYPQDVQEGLLLVPVETATSTVVAGGSLSIQNESGVAEINAWWMQQLALNQTQPQVDGYQLLSPLLDQVWLTFYSTILQNLKILNEKAELHKNYSYAVVAKILTAYNLGVITDMWGDIPYSKAFDGNLRPAYDSQEDIYKTIQSLLDSAITENSLATGASVPGGDDFIYNGDMSKWEKFAYALKARSDIHLTKAPGYDAKVQSALALTDLQNGFASQDDEADFSAYSDNPGSESPWFENIDPGQGGVVLASTLIDSLMNRADPRLPILADTGNAGNYEGRIIGSTPAPDFTEYSVINSFYASIDAPVVIAGYSEALFIKAEAIFRISGAAAAQPAYINAINSDMNKLGLDTNSAAVLTYLGKRGTLTDANGLQRIMEEKSIADFLSIENYNDWRRTGFPLLLPVANSYIPTIPLRYPYPLNELTGNPQPQQSAQLTDKVWWDQ